MYNWKLWIWPGLAAVACLTALAIWFQAGVVEADLKSRALAALRQDNAWAQVSLKGRDLILTGLAPDKDSQSRALKTVRTTYGVRVASDNSTLLPEEKPFRLTVEKNVDGLVLSGFVPNESARANILAGLSNLLPGIAVSDQMKLARGAPDGLVDLVTYGLSAFTRFSTGSFELTDYSLRVSGQALNPDDHQAALAALSAPLPSGGVLESVNIMPAAVSGDYNWSASISADGMELSGYAPDAVTRDGILATAKASAQDRPVTDLMRFASGVPSGMDWNAATAEALAIVSHLNGGTVSIRGKVLDVSGQAVDGQAFRQIQEMLATGLSSGLVLGTADIGVAVASPYVWTATRDGEAVSLSGVLPSEAVRARILEIAHLKFGALQIIDSQNIGAGAPDGFETAVLTALQALSRLDDNAETRVEDQAVIVQGAALSQVALDDTARLLEEGLPQGFEGQSSMDLAPTPEASLQVSDCQAELNRLVATNNVLFETAEAAIQDHSYGFLDHVAFVARQCGQAQLEISGHTDSDGAEVANLDLSERRAKSVLAFMIAAGVAADRMTAIGYGESKPVESNETDAGKAANRRIEFRVLN
ncbi:outer membrane protein/peptidoglycan-associated (lipo)protein [Hoeflea sp. IMCC20628]|uniref:OmpA family protein n=1 Tax=Hoeflea sp. IMCC20628 TaxID=1620421 RepID=UPI00063B08D7|nr:OmpA family protein [Hoeflea sp. IMCC20628]AKH99863.1 outer membrane protein/peptidoglycan-associated (lipo)protein [Hoeflea sp. IMCC20628]